MYWITRLDSISATVGVLIVLCGIAFVAMFAVWQACRALADNGIETEYNRSWEKTGKLVTSICFPLFLIFLIGNTFIPTTKDAYIIYGVGGTLDYLKSDETAKQLPHKVIVAMDKCLENLMLDDKESKKEEDK